MATCTSPRAGALLVTVLVLGAIPFCALGLVIGLMFDSQTAQVAQMITLLVLAFLGGIFIQWSSLPHGMQLIGKALPSYHLAQLGWNAAGRPRARPDEYRRARSLDGRARPDSGPALAQ